MNTPTEALTLARNALADLVEAADSMRGTYGCIQGRHPEDDDTYTHEKWAEGFLHERAELARAAIDALAQQPSAPSVEPAADLREKLIAAIAAGLVSTYHCNRVWSAWHVGTMSEDDFSPVDESDTPAEIADVVLSIIGAAPLMANGLTEAETAATASVAGMVGSRTLTEAQIERHAIAAKDCPQNSQVILVRSIQRLLGYTPTPQAAPVAPEQAKADGRLHADGYFTWARRDGYAMDKKLPCDFYLAAPAAPAPTTQPQAAMPVPIGWRPNVACTPPQHFGSVEALRVYTVKITKQAQAAQAQSVPATGAQPMALDVIREAKQDAMEVFDAEGPETPQTVRDVIEYMASWLEVYAHKRASPTAPTGSAG